MGHLRWVMFAGLALLAAVAVAGCDSDRPASEQPVPEPAASVKVGFIVAGERPTYLRAAQLAVDEINASGGLLGMPVELVSLFNPEASLPRTLEAAEDMLVRDGVIALIGPNRSTHAVEVGPLAQRYGVPMVTTSATNPRVTEAGDFVFMASVTDAFQGRVMAQFARLDHGLATAALLTLREDVYTEGISEFFAENFERLGGTVVANAFYDEGTTDFSDVLAGIADLRPDAFFVSAFVSDIPRIVRQAQAIPMRDAAGNLTLLLGTDTWDSEILLAEAGADLEGSFFTTHFSPDTHDPNTRAFIAAYEEAYGAEPSGGDAVNYDAVYLLHEAAERAGSLDPEAIRDELSATEDYAGATRIAHYDFNRHPAKNSVILTIVDGQKQLAKEVRPRLGRVVIQGDGEPGRDRWGTDPFQLNAASIMGDTLSVSVSYGGGCRTHRFTLVASNAFMESYPVQLRASLAHVANDDPCRAWVTADYDFDLTPIKRRYQEGYRQEAGTIILILEDNPGDGLVYEFVR